MITALDEYQAKGPGGAVPCMLIRAFDDLIMQKQIGLIRAQFRDNLSKEQAGKLLKACADIYAGSNTLYEEFVRPFNVDPRTFNYTTFLQAFNKFDQ